MDIQNWQDALADVKRLTKILLVSFRWYGSSRSQAPALIWR